VLKLELSGGIHGPSMLKLELRGRRLEVYLILSLQTLTCVPPNGRFYEASVNIYIKST